MLRIEVSRTAKKNCISLGCYKMKYHVLQKKFSGSNFGFRENCYTFTLLALLPESRYRTFYQAITSKNTGIISYLQAMVSKNKVGTQENSL
jgi:hypothetical protein